MTGRLDGKVAFITGAARGQGRAHALRLASEGAGIIAIDACEPVPSIAYPMATIADLEETAALVRKGDGRIVAVKADVRDSASLDAAVAQGLAEFGRLDLVVANAGVTALAPSWEMSEDVWSDVININLSGVWRTAKATIPSIIAGGNGGAITFIGSIGGMRGARNLAGYAAAKHGLVGLMRTLANELAPYNIRVNTVHPTNVGTDMILNDAVYKAFAPHLEHPTKQDAIPGFARINLLDVAYLDPSEIANAVLWLASDESRYVTGTELPVDAGVHVKSS